MTPRYTSTGCSKPWQSTGYKDRSSLGGAFENAGIVIRIGGKGGLGLLAFFAVIATLISIFPAASPARLDAQHATSVEARPSAKVG